MRFLIIDGNDGPCIRSLFTAVAHQGHEVAFLRPYVFPLFLSTFRSEIPHLFRWRHDPAPGSPGCQVAELSSCSAAGSPPFTSNVPLPTSPLPTLHSSISPSMFLPIPGFARFPTLSLSLIRWAQRSAERHFGRPDVVVFTMPHYAPLVGRKGQPVVGLPSCQVVSPTPPASSLSNEEPRTTQPGTPLPSSLPFPVTWHLAPGTCHSPAHVYFAYDAYRFYPGWNRPRVEAQEAEIAAQADAFFVISRQIEDDWRGRTRGPLLYLPNATSTEFIEAGRKQLPRPADLAPFAGRKLVGCIGDLAASSVDWPLVDHVARQFHEVAFLFLGRSFAPSAPMRAALQRPNVRWMGVRPHESLPAYMQHFDVLWNPMPMDELSHRRCPLRLYDYLSSTKPVLSTNIREAVELCNYVVIVKTPEEAASVLDGLLRGAKTGNHGQREDFIRDNVRDQSATRFVALVRICQLEGTHDP